MLKIFFKNVALVMGSTMVFFAIAEGVSRWLYFVPQLAMVDEAGRTVLVAKQDHFRLAANRHYRIRSKEFDASTTHTALGYRGREIVANPEMVFLGDSNTFGFGLSDEQTFAHLYCREAGIACVNLGRPSSGTRQQVRILEHYLQTENWRPREVRLFVYAMTRVIGVTNSFEGNDLGDNLHYQPPNLTTTQSDCDACTQAITVEQSWWVRLLEHRRMITKYSNLVRAVYFWSAPFLRGKLAPPADPQRLQHALALTGQALQTLEALSEQYGFTYRVYLLHPLVDLTEETYADTYQKLREVTPGNRLTDTAQLFTGAQESEDYYYPYDGHFNPAGARKLADFLLTETLD